MSSASLDGEFSCKTWSCVPQESPSSSLASLCRWSINRNTIWWEFNCFNPLWSVNPEWWWRLRFLIFTLLDLHPLSVLLPLWCWGCSSSSINFYLLNCFVLICFICDISLFRCFLEFVCLLWHFLDQFWLDCDAAFDCNIARPWCLFLSARSWCASTGGTFSSSAAASSLLDPWWSWYTGDIHWWQRCKKLQMLQI